jgi:hypothetical protein
MTSQNNNTDTELYRFASAYMDKLELITRDVTNACNQISNVKIKLDDLEKELSSKKRYICLNWIKTLGFLISPILLFVALIFISKYAPCGQIYELGGAKLITSSCESSLQKAD